MMMAFHSNPSPPSLDEETLAAMRAAMARYASDGESTGELREALCRASAEARDKGIPPERLLIALKELWAALAEVRSARAEEQRRRLQQLIGWCIREYYGG